MWCSHNTTTNVAFAISLYLDKLCTFTRACLIKMPPSLWPMNIRGRVLHCFLSASHVENIARAQDLLTLLRFCRRRSRSCVAACVSLFPVVSKTGQEL